MTSPPGVFVSRIDTDAWEPDTEVGGSAHVLVSEGSTVAGLWRSDPDHPSIPGAVEIPARETLLVLEGSVRVGLDGAATLELTEGDMVSIPRGSRVDWNPSADCKVFWVYS